MLLKMLAMQHQSRQGGWRQEVEPPLPLLDLLRLVWPGPLARGVSLAWVCWRGPACPTLLWLDGSGTGCIPVNSFFRQEPEVPAGKTIHRNH